MRKALFLDRDGTINVDKGYTYKVEDLQFIEGMPELIKTYNDSEYLVIVITNQAGIGRGHYTEADMQKFHDNMNKELREKYGAHIDAFYFCPHHPEYGIGEYKIECKCRKPNSGMLERAIKEFDIDVKRSVLIGDKDKDVQCGHNVGIGIVMLLYA